MFESITEKLNLSENVKKALNVKTEVAFSPALNAVENFGKSVNRDELNAESETLIITTDSGYFAVGKTLRDELKTRGANVAVFCSDDGEIAARAVKDFVFSFSAAKFAVIIGDAKLYKVAAMFLKAKNLPDIFVPTDCEAGAVFGGGDRLLSCDIKNAEYFYGLTFGEPQLIAFDKELIEKCANKYKNYSACCYAESARLLNFEAQIIKAISEENENAQKNEKAGYADEISALFIKSQSLLSEFYSKRDYTSLFFACVTAGLIKRYADFADIGDAAQNFSELINGYARGENAFGGELEFYVSQILFLTYENFLRFKFCGDGRFFLTPPDNFSKTRKLEKDFGIVYSNLPKLPNYFYNDEILARYVNSLFKNEFVLETTNKTKVEFEKSCDKLKNVYGGKKRAVRSLSEKIKSEAFNLTPFLTCGDCLLKIMCACGALEE